MFLKNANLGRNEWWWYVITLVLVVIAALLGSIPLLPVANATARKNGLTDRLFEFYSTTDYTLIGMEPWLFLLLMLVPFVVVLGVLWLCVRYIHRKPVGAILTGRQLETPPPADSLAVIDDNPQPVRRFRFDWKRFGYGFLLWLVLSIALEGVHYLFHPEFYTFNFRADRFFPVLVVALLLLPLQVAAEEIVMRGYLMQAVALLSKHRWIPLLVTSLLFGLLHFANPETGEFGFLPAMYGYIFMGLFLGLITLLDDGLELPIGIHFANNLYAATITTYPAAALPLPALFSISELNIWTANAVLTVGSIAFLFLAARKYGWQLKNLKAFLFTDPIPAAAPVS